MATMRAALSVLVLLLLSSVGNGQVVIQQQRRPGMPPPRDPVQQKTGTAMIAGRITAADTGAPLRRVQVRLQSPELRSGRTALTDADGKYFVRELPAGRYTIFAMKSGYVMMSYGQKRPMQQGTPIELSDGQKVETANIALPRGGVITGRIVDDFGDPVVDARVFALQYRWFNGRRRTMSAGRTAMTNDRGEYRIWGLAPGEYYIGASATDRMGFGGPEESIGTSGDSSGYTVTYYPGTGSVDEAQRVTVTPAQELAGIDVALMLIRTFRVTGIALASDGKPMSNGFVNLTPRTELEGGMGMGGLGSGIENGAFTIAHVPPGEYTLVARGGESAAGSGGLPPETATANLSVTAEDIKGLVVSALKGVRVSGRIVYEAGTPPPDAIARMRVGTSPPAGDFPPMFVSGAPAIVSPQGTFELTNISGKRRLSLFPAPMGWVVKSVRVGGTDITDTGYEFGKEDVSNVEILLTNRLTILTGTVKDAKGDVVTDAAVLIFPADEEYWGQAMSRRFTTSRLDQNGTYRVRALPPGTYFAVALDAPPDDWGNPDLFPKLKALATSFTLGEGETQTLELRMKELPQ